MAEEKRTNPTPTAEACNRPRTYPWNVISARSRTHSACSPSSSLLKGDWRDEYLNARCCKTAASMYSSSARATAGGGSNLQGEFELLPRVRAYYELNEFLNTTESACSLEDAPT